VRGVADRLLGDAEDAKRLAERLARLPEVTRFDEGEEKEAWTLTHAFSDLEQSFRIFLDEQLPRLADGTLADAEMYDLLLEIGEEFRHIAYHLRDPKFYRYVEGSPD
jgi:hypothetical protein